VLNKLPDVGLTQLFHGHQRSAE